MKRFIICVFVAFTILCMAACCSFSETEAKQKSMFVKVYSQSYYDIVYHAKTKVMYSVSCKGVFTLLVNSDGTPMVWEE